ncbi:unnamed protein product [Brassicogethes aeneus]|uniref:Uncharacterized protein n=1 Tax=Brassicogethes aeneus TaxID=1431903 RepID=A0A9P0B1Q8_BRAAE|nr:unnamed protein product [Brassicogethes aeneus]
MHPYATRNTCKLFKRKSQPFILILIILIMVAKSKECHFKQIASVQLYHDISHGYLRVSEEKRIETSDTATVLFRVPIERKVALYDPQEQLFICRRPKGKMFVPRKLAYFNKHKKLCTFMENVSVIRPQSHIRYTNEINQTEVDLIINKNGKNPRKSFWKACKARHHKKRHSSCIYSSDFLVNHPIPNSCEHATKTFCAHAVDICEQLNINQLY